jgi:hypothetical protein
MKKDESLIVATAGMTDEQLAELADQMEKWSAELRAILSAHRTVKEASTLTSASRIGAVGTAPASSEAPISKAKA